MIAIGAVQIYIEYFTHLSDQFLTQQKDVSVYQQSLRGFEASFAQANALVLEHIQAELEKTRERSAALVEQQDDQWKKKQIYD